MVAFLVLLYSEHVVRGHNEAAGGRRVRGRSVTIPQVGLSTNEPVNHITSTQPSVEPPVARDLPSVECSRQRAVFDFDCLYDDSCKIVVFKNIAPSVVLS